MIKYIIMMTTNNCTYYNTIINLDDKSFSRMNVLAAYKYKFFVCDKNNSL